MISSICNDSSFSHLSSGLGIKTIVLMADTPLIYGSYNTKNVSNYARWRKFVTHNTLGKDKINPIKFLNQLKKILIKKYFLRLISLASFTIVDNLVVSGEISG